MNDPRPYEEKTLYRGEAAAVYCFDFSGYPEVAAGATLSSPTVQISSGLAVVTLDTPLVTDATFEELDEEGNVEDSVATGKGVKVAVTPTAIGGIKGECIVTCLVKPSGGGADDRIGKRVKFIVV